MTCSVHVSSVRANWHVHSIQLHGWPTTNNFQLISYKSMFTIYWKQIDDIAVYVADISEIVSQIQRC